MQSRGGARKGAGKIKCINPYHIYVGETGRKYRHMFVIPFPVYAYAALYNEERQQMDDLFI